MTKIKNRRIVIAVTGSIAAYKAADVVRKLIKQGDEVHVMMTRAATTFITPLLMQVLSMNEVYVEMFEEVHPDQITHVAIGKEIDMFVVVPASANTINQMAYGLTQSIVTMAYLALPKHVAVYVAPAMNTNMYEHPATQESMQRLIERGVCMIEPIEGLLACNDIGKGALADIETIVDVLNAYKKEV